MYGILFSNELQKMAWGLKQLDGGMTRRAPTYNANSGVPENPVVDPRGHGQPTAGAGRGPLKPQQGTASPSWYQAANAQPQFDMTPENMGLPAPPKKDANYYANAMRADYARQQANNIKLPKGIDFSRLNGVGGGSGGISAMRGMSPQR